MAFGAAHIDLRNDDIRRRPVPAGAPRTVSGFPTTGLQTQFDSYGCPPSERSHIHHQGVDPAHHERIMYEFIFF